MTPETESNGAAIDPTPYIDLSPRLPLMPKRGKPRFGKLPRVMLPGATVDIATANQARRWRGKSLSLGLLIDQLVRHARTTHFKPTRNRK